MIEHFWKLYLDIAHDPLYSPIQDREDNKISVLDAVCPIIPNDMLWDGAWQNTSDKMLSDWVDSTLYKVYCVNVILFLSDSPFFWCSFIRWWLMTTMKNIVKS